jgi:hypothetical protein
MAQQLSDRRREAAGGTLFPAYRDGLARILGWAGNHRAGMRGVSGRVDIPWALGCRGPRSPNATLPRLREASCFRC